MIGSRLWAVVAATVTATMAGTVVAPITGADAAVAVVVRLAGNDRYATAAAVSRATFPTGAPVAYVASGTAWPDALAAGPAAARRRGPVLLTDPTALPGATATELARLRPAEVIVLGGSLAVADTVVGSLAPLVTTAVRRLAGPDRYGTALAVSTDTHAGPVPVVHVVGGLGFADALSAGPAAGMAGGPVLLVPPTEVPSAVRAEIRRLAPALLRIVGGPEAVPTAIEAELRLLAPVVVRVAGPDRYATAAALSAAAFPGPSPSVHLAAGADYPDALAAGPAAALAPGPVLLIAASCVPAAADAEITRLQPATMVVLGGPAALAPAVDQRAACPGAPPTTGTVTVAYVGCSNTQQTVAGYHAAGGRRLWPAIQAYGGGTVVSWGRSVSGGGDLWPSFAANLAAQPAPAVWWQLCIRAGEDDASSYAEALNVRAELSRRVPSATVYVSAINGFVAPHICNIAGASGPDRAAALAARLVAEGRSLPGPVVGNLRPDQTADGCHPNVDGQRLLGGAVLAFFG